MTNVIDLSKKRDPVTYTVHITHHWDGRIETFVEDVSDSERSRNSVAVALERAAFAYRKTHPADGMHAILLSLIDHVMGTTEEAPTVLKVSPQELSSWVDAVNKTIDGARNAVEYAKTQHAIIAWIKDDLPWSAKMVLKPKHVSMLVDRICGSKTIRARNEGSGDE